VRDISINQTDSSSSLPLSFPSFCLILVHYDYSYGKIKNFTCRSAQVALAPEWSVSRHSPIHCSSDLEEQQQREERRRRKKGETTKRE
jgi:hypothetical protein